MWENKSFHHSVLHFHRTKRKLLSTKIIDVWQPDTCKKPFVSLRRLSRNGKFYYIDISVKNKMCFACLIQQYFHYLSRCSNASTGRYFVCISEREQKLKRLLNPSTIRVNTEVIWEVNGHLLEERAKTKTEKSTWGQLNHTAHSNEHMKHR